MKFEKKTQTKMDELLAITIIQEHDTYIILNHLLHMEILLWKYVAWN